MQRHFANARSDDVTIALALQAHWHGASMRGVRLILSELLGKRSFNRTLLKWNRDYQNMICGTCVHMKQYTNRQYCNAYGLIIDELPATCQRHYNILIPQNIQVDYIDYLSHHHEWKPYYGLKPGPRATTNWRLPSIRRRYFREYYRQRPKWAMSLLKNPLNWLSRISSHEAIIKPNKLVD